MIIRKLALSKLVGIRLCDTHKESYTIQYNLQCNLTPERNAFYCGLYT